MSGWLIYLALGALAGLLAGLLGVGGGLVLVAALAWLLPLRGVPIEFAMQAALATSLASIVLTASSSASAHARRGSVLWPTVFTLLPGLLIGGWLGSLLATHLPGSLLRWGVALYCLLAAAQLLLAGNRNRDAHPDSPIPRDAGIAVAGLGIGLVSALVGIGGGSLTVPLLIWRRVAPVRAVGTSSACGVAIGLASAAGYSMHGPVGGLPHGSVGFVFLPAAVGIALASVLTAPLGARLAHRIGGIALQRVFALFLLLVGISLILRGI
ncbi:MAG: sulfite exporter TauE/SafE family protein [Lysobacteraceae bacterium]